jgi:hypothetical protein
MGKRSLGGRVQRPDGDGDTLRSIRRGPLRHTVTLGQADELCPLRIRNDELDLAADGLPSLPVTRHPPHSVHRGYRRDAKPRCTAYYFDIRDPGTAEPTTDWAGFLAGRTARQAAPAPRFDDSIRNELLLDGPLVVLLPRSHPSVTG